MIACMYHLLGIYIIETIFFHLQGSPGPTGENGPPGAVGKRVSILTHCPNMPLLLLTDPKVSVYPPLKSP